MKLYLVQNHEGKYFRAKGYGGRGLSWVDLPEHARIYTKIGPATSIITWWSNHTNLPVAKLVVFDAQPIEIIDMTEKMLKKKLSHQKKIEKNRIKQNQHTIKCLQEAIAKEQRILEQLKSETSS
jgi:hypothetical protein